MKTKNRTAKGRSNGALIQAIEQLETRVLLSRPIGLDTSYAQTNVNWTSVAGAGRSVAIFRADYGNGTQDSQFSHNVSSTVGAEAAGLYASYYHYAYFDVSGHTALSESTDYFNIVKPYLKANGKTLQPMLDIEEALPSGWNGTTLATWVNDWCNNVRSLAQSQLGLYVTPMIYIGASNAGNTGYINFAGQINWPLVVAQWPGGTVNPQTQNPSGTGQWNDWSFWQYADNGHVAGVGDGTTTNVDLDVFHYDNYALQDFVIGGSRWSAGNWIKVAATGGTPVWNDSTANTAAPYNDTKIEETYNSYAKVLNSTPVYANGYWRYYVQFTNGVTGWAAEVDMATATPSAPTNPTPATNSIFTSATQPSSFTWNASTYASAYQVFLDGTLKATVSTNSWTPGTISNGAHTWQVKAVNAENTTAGSTWNFTKSAVPAAGKATNPYPADNAFTNVKPITLTWTAADNAVSYNIYSGGVFYENVTTTSFGPISPIDGAHTWRIDPLNSDGLATTGDTWSFTMDTTAPTASLDANESPASGSGSFDFTVTYADATSGLNASTFDSSDITVTGPNSFSENASFVSAAGNVVTYAMTAPGGTWNLADNGTYTVSVNANEVKDNAGNPVAAGSVGTFNASAAYAYLAGDTLHIGYLPAVSTVTINNDGSGNTTLDENGNDLSFATASFSNVLIDGTAGDNNVTLNASLGTPLAFDGGAGNDTLTLGAGVSQSFDSDASAMSANLNLIVDATATATFNSAQHLGSLTVNGSASSAAGGSNTIVTKALSIGGFLDLNNNSLIVDYDTTSPIGTWNGSAYDGLTGLIASGRDGGAWDGIGLRSSNAASSGGLTTLGIGESADVLQLTAGQTGTFAGQTVDDTAVLIKYTYAGDANLDGRINGDDYFAIDGHVNLANSNGWANGDFNFDGRLNGDDYFIIDSNINTQGSPL